MYVFVFLIEFGFMLHFLGLLMLLKINMSSQIHDDDSM